MVQENKGRQTWSFVKCIPIPFSSEDLQTPTVLSAGLEPSQESAGGDKGCSAQRPAWPWEGPE